MKPQTLHCHTTFCDGADSPAAMAAAMDRKGWPEMATTAPTAAPRVKQPSVDRSHTFSML